MDVASGIAGLITLALEVSGALAKYVIAIKDHSKNVKELHDELQLLGNVLSRLSEFIKNEATKGRSFEKDSVLVNAIRDCKKRIERIGDKIKIPDGGKISRTIDKLKWPFEQRDVLQMVDNLRRYIHTFEFAITIKNSEFLSQSWDDANKNLQDLQKKIDQACETNKMLGEPIEKLLERSQQLQEVLNVLPILSQQSEDIKELSQAVKLAEQREQERRKADILDWLAPLSTLHKHVDLQNRRAPGTCAWLLQSEIFTEWVESDTVYDVLCQGGPGVGKTILCSIVTDHLRTRYKNDEVAVVHYYFDLAEQQAQTEYSLARSILRQLCQNFHFIPTAVAEFYQRTRNELQDALWLQELKSVLQRIISTFSQCFIIVDAFDEMDAKKRIAHAAVLEAVKASSGCVKFFATSRPHVVLEQFEHALKLEVRADEKDLRHFLSYKIEAHPHSSDFIDQTMKDEILDKLCSHADGVFLLPALQIDQILDQAVSPGDIERALTNLSTDLKQVFQSTIARMEGFSGGRRNLAFKSLMWLSHARRPLRIPELQHAIAVRPDKADLDARDVSSISVILDSCCGLVELDGESACVRLVHGSIAEYLQSQDHGFFRDAEIEISRVCFQYLTMEQLKTLPFKNRNDFIKALEFFPLLEYTSSYWGYHARCVDVQRYHDLATPFFNSSLHMLVTARARDIRTTEFRKWQERMLAWSVSGGAGVSLAASYGITDLVRLLIGQMQNPVLNARNMYGSTPLHQCAILGYDSTAEVLIAHGADLLDSNKGKATPFYLAVSYGQLETCKVLLKYGRSQLDVICKEGNTALHKAADLGSETMVEFLLQSGSLLESRNASGMTALHLAARRGYTAIVRMLVLRGMNIHASDNNRATALDFAASSGCPDTVKYLLEQGADVNHNGHSGWASLHHAARTGHTDVIKLLLDAGAHLLDFDRQKYMPFQLAIRSGNFEATKLILHHDSTLTIKQLKHKDRKNDRAIHMAFYTSNYEIYEYLRDLESELFERTPSSDTDPLLPLIHAIEQGQLLRVQELLTSNPELLEAKDDFNQTPLHTAFRTCQQSIAEFLLFQGAPINSRGYHGWTPLHIAASLGNLPMTTLALQWNADIFLVSDTLQTPLHKAAAAQSLPVIIELLRCGCLPTARNDKAMTPIHVAAHRNFFDALQAMMRPEFGGSRTLLLTRDKFGRTPRDWAERAGHLDLSAVLRGEERRAKGRLGSSDNLNDSIDSMRPLASRASSQLSRQSTREASNRRNTGSSLLLPSLEHSVSSLDSVETPENLEGSGSGRSTPARTHGTPARSMSNLASRTPSLYEIERRYAEMQMEFESD